VPSAFGLMAVPRYRAYAASKFAVRRSPRRCVRRYRFDRRIARTTPEKPASTILRVVERGRAQILVGADAHLV